jgi:hypothetical protein
VHREIVCIEPIWSLLQHIVGTWQIVRSSTNLEIVKSGNLIDDDGGMMTPAESWLYRTQLTERRSYGDNPKPHNLEGI